MSEISNASQASEASVSAPETVASEQPSTPQVETTTTDQSLSPTTPTETAKPAYTPNFKFKYPKLDSNDQEEKEFDDWAKGFVNADNEAKLRDLYTKAYGMDFYKQKYGKINDQFKGYKDKYEPLVKTWNELTEVYNAGDMETFFKALKIPEEKLYQFVLDKLNEREMSPEQRMERQRQTELKQRAMMLERENQSLQERYKTEITQAREFQLGQTLSKPEVSQTAKSFDERVGRPGAFREEVIKRGIMAFHATGQDISPEQAVQEVLSLIGGAQTTQAAQVAQQPQVQATQKSQPVIPNVGARASSPAKRAPRSLSDLKKLAETM